MKRIVFPFLLFICVSIYGQNKDKVFRIAYNSYEVTSHSYRVTALILSENNQYALIEQKYISRRFARKNIPSKVLKTYGIWTIKNDTLKLIDNENKTEMLFIMKRNFLVYLFNNEEPTNFHWKKINE